MQGYLIVNEYVNSIKFNEIFKMLVDSAKSQDVNLEIKTNAEMWKILADYEYQISARDLKIDFIIFWDKDIKLARVLEESGIRLFNSSRSIEICDDKSLTFLELRNKGIIMPKTFLSPKVFHQYSNLEYFYSVCKITGYPCIIKECLGSFGQQVYLVNNKNELEQTIIGLGNRPFIIQQYIESSKGRDIRIQIVGNQVVATMYRYNDHDFRANISNGGRMKQYNITQKQCDMALQVSKELKLDFGGIDILFGVNNEPIFCEANSNAHFKNLYDCTGINTADYIIRYIKEIVK